MMMLSDNVVGSHTNEWYDKFLKESEENQKLRSELEEARAKYDSLLEASLQQMAARIDEFAQPEKKFDRKSPPVSSGIRSSDAGTSATASNEENHANGDKTRTATATPPKEKPKGKGKPFFNFGRNKPFGKGEKPEDKPGGLYPMDEEIRTDFVLPLAPSTSYQHLPRLQVCPLVSRNHVVIAGPTGPVGPVPGDDAGSASFMDIVAGRSISTYPHIPNNPNRDGDPIADRFSSHVFENRVIAAVADGCNWGAKPREAALKANTAFIEYVNASHDSITDVKKAGAVLLNAFEYAHNSIMEGKLAFWDAGTTTLLGGVLLEINKGTDKWTPQWEFVCASVGDCKAFCYSNGEITDITQGNRQNASDPRDCGGRLGPHLDEGKPDLRNLNLFCAPCEDGDLIIIVTDGIHDNLDPQHLGKLPKDMPKEFNLGGDKWDDVDPAKAIYAKNAYITELLLRLLKTGEETPTPREVADRLVNHCIEVTQKSRDYMEQNQGKRLPEDYVEFPGKMDHTTCLCFRVGRFPTLPEKGTIFSGSKEVSLALPSSSPNVAISSSSPLGGSGNQITRQEDGSPRLGSPNNSASNLASPKFDNWTKITPTTKHP